MYNAIIASICYIKKEFYGKLNISSITNNKMFWKVYAHYFLTSNYLKAQKLYF